MSSREEILKRIKESGMEPVPLLEVSAVEIADGKPDQFVQVLTAIGGHCHFIQKDELDTYIQGRNWEKPVVNVLQGSPHYNLSRFDLSSASSLETVHTVVLKGMLGVAENGAIWLEENAMGHRLLPFIAQHLVLVLEASGIVATMEVAYQQIHLNPEGFGVFIAGPSKTADIEQSLVIGAHGPIEMEVILLQE